MFRPRPLTAKSHSPILLSGIARGAKDWLRPDEPPVSWSQWSACRWNRYRWAIFWTYELKLDGYRLVAVKTGGKVTLYSRKGTDLSQRFKLVAANLATLPDETVIDGEVVALDEQGKPNFNLLQNFRPAESHIMF